MKIDGILVQKNSFEVENFEGLKLIRRIPSILKLHNVKIERRRAQNARFETPTCLISGVWLSCGFAVSMRGGWKNISFSKVSKQVVMWFCVASVALCDNRLSLPTSRKTFWVTFAVFLPRFQKMNRSFLSDVQYFGDIRHHFAWQTHQFRRVALRVLHSSRHTPHFKFCTAHSWLYTPHFTTHTPHPPHSTLHTVHYALHTPHLKLHISHSTIYTLHSKLH